MRLSDEERAGILRAIATVLPDAQVYLYGSRVQNHLRGGDIDLLILFNDTAPDATAAPLNIFDTKINLAVALERELGERRIDITLASPENLAQDAFLQTIWPTAVPLIDPSKSRDGP